MPDIGTAFREGFQDIWKDGYQFGDVLNTAFLPLSSVNRWLDVTGSEAAKEQFINQSKMNAEANAFSASEAEKQRQWEAEMSNTAIQRKVKDLEAAGLNPWLAVQNGIDGASTPSGSSASAVSGTAAKGDNKLAIAAGIIATALRMFLTKGK